MFDTLLYMTILGWHIIILLYMENDHLISFNVIVFVLKNIYVDWIDVCDITLLHTSYTVIDRYLNFGNTYLSKEFARVLFPGQRVTSLEHLGTVPGIQAWTTSALC
jgi:hypothetical protein